MLGRFREDPTTRREFLSTIAAPASPPGTAERRRLWQAVSGDAANGRDVRPLQILTGGNPRLLVVVAGFSRHWSLRRLVEKLVMLIDEHTEYFVVAVPGAHLARRPLTGRIVRLRRRLRP